METEALNQLIGEFKKIRKSQGKSRRELGEEMDLHQNTIKYWENRGGKPSDRNLYKILKYLSENSDSVSYLRSQKTFIDMSSGTLWHVQVEDGEKVATYGENWQETLEALDYHYAMPSHRRGNKNPEDVAKRFFLTDLNITMEDEEIVERFRKLVETKLDPYVVTGVFKKALELLLEKDKDTTRAEREIQWILVNNSTLYRVRDAISKSQKKASPDRELEEIISETQDAAEKFLKAVESHRKRNSDRGDEPDNTEEFLDKLDDDLDKI